MRRALPGDPRRTGRAERGAGRRPRRLGRALRSALPEPEAARRTQPRRRGLFARLRENLAKPRQTISPQLAGIYAGKLVTAETWDELEEALITADCGMDATLELVEELRAEAAQGRIMSGADLGAGPARRGGGADGARAGPDPARGQARR